MRTSTFKNELQKTQDLQSGNMVKELERQQTFIDKMRAETRYNNNDLESLLIDYGPPAR